MHKQPLHRLVRIAIACRKQCLLAANHWEAHPLKLRHCLCIEFRQTWCRILVFWEWFLARLKAAPDVLVKLQDIIVRKYDWNI